MWPVMAGALMAYLLFTHLKASVGTILLRYLPISVVGGFFLALAAMPVFHVLGLITNIDFYRDRYEARKARMKRNRSKKK